MFKKHRILMTMCFVCVLLIAGVGVYSVKIYKEDVNKRLPISVTVDATNPENIAYSLWYAYMKPYLKTINPLEKLSNVYFTRFQMLQNEKNGFSIDIVFTVQLKSKNWSVHRHWGKAKDDGTIENLQWTLKIKKAGMGTYTLEHIVPKPTSSNLPADHNILPAENKVVHEKNTYKIENGRLKVTYDYGQHWIDVPVSIHDLFEGDYSGPKDTLIEGSFVISPDRTAFVIGNGKYLRILQSTDQGYTWKENNVRSPIEAVRLRLLGFTSKQDGYLILTGDRTMTVEGNVVLKTHDGGQTWENVGYVPTDRLATGGGFIDDQLGFMSFGSRGTPAHPVLYRTTDGGKSWNEVAVPIPSHFRGIFTVAEVPAFKGSRGTLLVNQGPDGDYQGGKVMAKFTSKDKGATWSFEGLISPK